MTAYFPNFHELFLTRYCRDKLVCAPKCRRMTVASVDAPIVYPNVQKMLRPFYRNLKITHFNDAYQQLSYYLKSYPEELEQVNAILWRWIQSNSQRHCRVQKNHHRNSNWLASRKKCRKASLACCQTSCDDSQSSNWNTQSCSTQLKSSDTGASSSKSTSSCTKSSKRKTSQKDTATLSSDSSSDNESYSESTANQTKSHSSEETKSTSCDYEYESEYQSKYDKENCCPGDNFVCEPKHHRVKWAVPRAKEVCYPLPCTGTLQRDLMCVVPKCLKEDEQLVCLVSDVVKNLL